ncbi:FecR domain-containing protein [Bremerella alba]|uniref:FecR protein domain-containing protein n=1 Tax=Bremerella alba TaxID=980252 RepID=A0A7V8VAF2_9BACT|nr:FecR domain-containing protein [Bremerella alba]MBA2117825.1 hypothetical protein [Bremerella alba]
MKNDSRSLNEVSDLADRYYIGHLDEEGIARLNELLLDNPEAQKAFLEVASVYARLQWEYSNTSPTSDRPALENHKGQQSTPISRSPVYGWHSWATISALAFLVFAVWGLWQTGYVSPSIQGNVALATVSQAIDTHWTPGFAPQGPSLFAQRLRLEKGLAQLTFSGGAIAVLKAPVDLELLSANEAFLHQGQAVIRIPEGSSNDHFHLETQKSRVVDLGTEFGVEVDDEGDSLLQVYEGEVQVTSKTLDDLGSPQLIREREAVVLGSTPQKTEFWAERFVRELPGPDDPAGPGLFPYNESQIQSVRIARADKPLDIDADLSDWNLSYRFHSTAKPPYAENYYLEAAMMYDDQNLYISAHVGDPHPMKSKILPSDPADQHGAGGSVALRLSTDRQAGWPVEAMNPSRRHGIIHPTDRSEQLAFVVLWYSQSLQKPCIHLRYGMDLHGTQVNPPGYRGAFRKDKDGRGYTLEYAIPWSLLNAETDPPQSGDELAAMWLVHWSDTHGRRWQGQIIDVTNPEETDWNFVDAATWGKAIYLD